MDDKLFSELKASATEMAVIRKLLRAARAAKEWYEIRQAKGAGTKPEFNASLRFLEALKEVEDLL